MKSHDPEFTGQAGVFGRVCGQQKIGSRWGFWVQIDTHRILHNVLARGILPISTSAK